MSTSHPPDYSLLIGCEAHPDTGRAEHNTEGCTRALLNPADRNVDQKQVTEGETQMLEKEVKEINHVNGSKQEKQVLFYTNF